MRNDTILEIGTRVTIVAPPEEEWEPAPGFNELMKKYDGMRTRITGLTNGGDWYRIAIDKGQFAWAARWLELDEVIFPELTELPEGSE